MAFASSTGIYTPATGAITAFAGQTIASATWNSIFTSITTALSQLGQNACQNLLLVSDTAGTNVNTAQPWFPTGTASTTMAASTKYFMEGCLYLSRSAGTNSHTISTLFAGAATLTSINYVVEVTDQNATTSTLSTPSVIDIAAATATAVTGASANAAQFNCIKIRGVVQILGAGTFTPQFIYSVAPGGAPTVLANSWFKTMIVGV